MRITTADKKYFLISIHFFQDATILPERGEDDNDDESDCGSGFIVALLDPFREVRDVDR